MWYMAALKGLPKEESMRQIPEILAAVELDDVPKRKIGALSGGMKQRLTLAQAVLGDPEILILDEPTAGLDPLAKENLLKEIFGAIKKSGVTIILVSHNMEDIARFANRVIVLAQGKILFTGTPRELFAQEKILARAGLEPPPITQLLHKLNLKENVLTLDEAEKIILKDFRRH